jgi:hypothetical protein
VPEPEAGAGRGTTPIGRFKIRRGTIAAESWRSTPIIELALEVAYCDPPAKAELVVLAEQCQLGTVGSQPHTSHRDLIPRLRLGHLQRGEGGQCGTLGLAR